MPKNGNLLKFWESLEQQSKDEKQSSRPNTQPHPASLARMRSISHCDLLGHRQEQLQEWKKEKDESVVEPVQEVEDRGVEHDITANYELPQIPRQDILTNATKNRVKRLRKHPVRVRLTKERDQVPSVKINASVEKKTFTQSHQTSPASASEFSSCSIKSPTSSSFLDRSPNYVINPGTPPSSEQPAPNLTRTPSTFSTFLRNPPAKTEEQNQTKKEAPIVPQRKIIQCSPKLLERYEEKPKLNALPSKILQSSVSPSKPEFHERKFASLKVRVTPKPDFVERRNSLKAVTSPYKPLKDAITPIKSEQGTLPAITSPRIANLAASFKTASSAITDKSAVLSNIFKGETSTTTTSTSTALAHSISTASLPISVENNSSFENLDMDDLSIKEYKDEINKKVKILEDDLAEEKLARIRLEKEVEKLKLIVAKFDS